MLSRSKKPLQDEHVVKMQRPEVQADTNTTCRKSDLKMFTWAGTHLQDDQIDNEIDELAGNQRPERSTHTPTGVQDTQKNKRGDKKQK